MDQVLLFALLGLGSGALIAGIALAVVLIYRGSGIINIATGGVAMLAGYTFWSLRTGEFGTEFGTAPALLITLLVTLVIGALIELVAFRPLRNAAPLAKLVSSLGVLLVAQYRWTRFGLATRAASENELSALLGGLSANELSMVNTLLASVVAGAIGVLAASVTQLDAISLPLQVVPALAAALLARLTSFSIACAAGLGIGIVNSEIDYLSTMSWFPTDHGVPLPGVKELIAFLIIITAMFLRGAALPSRGELIEQRLPAVPRPTHLARPAVVAGAVCA